MTAPRRPRWKPKPPPGLRPKLTRGQLTDLGLAHLANVDAISQGRGTPEILQQHQAGSLTWLLAAQEMARRDSGYTAARAAMEAAVVACKDVADRYRRTGRIGFSGLEYQMAREAVEWMDALAAVVDRDVAVLAAEASEEMMGRVGVAA